MKHTPLQLEQKGMAGAQVGEQQMHNRMDFFYPKNQNGFLKHTIKTAKCKTISCHHEVPNDRSLPNRGFGSMIVSYYLDVQGNAQEFGELCFQELLDERRLPMGRNE